MLSFTRRHPDPAQAPLVMSGGLDGTARIMHVQNKRVVATMVHSQEEEVWFCTGRPVA